MGTAALAFPHLRRRVDIGALDLKPPRRRIREAVDDIRPRMITARARAARTFALPTDRTLQIARERLLTALPEAADTKWRIASLFLRETVRANVREHPLATGDALRAAGDAFMRVSEPETGWTSITILEACHRITRTLNMEGTVRRQGNEIDIVTTDCPFIVGVESANTASICEAVCGERASLLQGVTGAIGGRLESPRRMGDGHLYCIRSLQLPSHLLRAIAPASTTPVSIAGVQTSRVNPS